MKEIIIYSDYVCPFCLIAEKIVEEVIKEKDITIQWKPFELRPYPTPTLKVDDEYLPSIWEKSVYPMAKKYNIPIKLPSISPQPRTTKAFEAFIFAQKHNLGDEFSAAVLSAFFQKDMDIGDFDVLSNIGAKLGLDKEALKKSLENDEFKEEHKKALKQTQKDNITGVPTIIIGEDRCEGVPSIWWIEQAIEKLNPRAKS
ncbi:MAG: DsbA family protein [Campylobacteraceae bacterium]|nr:DsbA family protein [Campylobacteraceae bacterium]